MKISVFGLGYVGSVTAACLADKGHPVAGVELNPDKLALFQAGRSPLFEPGLAELLAKVHGTGGFRATDSAAEAVRDSVLSFICVGTPSRKDGAPDLAHIERVCRDIGSALRTHPETSGTGVAPVHSPGSPERTGATPVPLYAGKGVPRHPPRRNSILHTIVVRSTMLPGSIERVVTPALEAASGKREGADFHVVANPEFMREGTAIADFFEPSFVVIGERTAGAGDTLAALYQCVAAPQVRTSIRTAEAIKFACNAFHGLKITFANEFGQFCKAQGVDAQEVMAVFCRETKLNISPAYLRPGPAFGGSCLPKDLRALVQHARSQNLELPMLEHVAPSNTRQIQHTIDRVVDLKHRAVGILGLSFKTGTDDLRESPVVIMAETLLGKGFQLAIHDSEVELTRLTGANKRFLEEKLPHINSLLVANLNDVVARTRTLVVCKKHPDFQALPDLVTPDHHVLDLVGFLKTEKFPTGCYQGLYW